MDAEYVEQRDGGYWIKGTRISLDSVVYAFQRGASPESIRRSYPLLSLTEVYGAITFYLARQREIDDYLKEEADKFAAERRAERDAEPEFYRKFDEARKEREAVRR